MCGILDMRGYMGDDEGFGRLAGFDVKYRLEID